MTIQLAKNFYIAQGSTFNYDMTLSDENGAPINLHPYTILAQLKSSYNNTIPEASFNITMLSASAGMMRLTLPASSSAALQYDKLLHDVMATHTGSLEVTRLLYGISYISRTVSL